MARNDNLGSALNLMEAIISAGGEFPDACFKASSRFDCDYELLADTYDEMDADRNASLYGGNDDRYQD